MVPRKRKWSPSEISEIRSAMGDSAGAEIDSHSISHCQSPDNRRQEHLVGLVVRHAPRERQI